ncbi:YDG domain-containing protein [Roseateles depolymerans]|uniref:Uncharacterized protein n=1 Tax=Roseateles depolymerans TaxID=76731 RepID=A0A0U3LID4_9BURK|nr:YDG domain-containing protein [Roseateles depolymerans]ALV07855.1 hypothetical protein RD2015_3398 [Roseateles depolymerans]REG21923.1 filamentous hemagglutinin family protein [Roseateles depolymerans]
MTVLHPGARRARTPASLAMSSSCLGGLFALSLLSQAMAQALPGTATVVSGQADITRTTNAVTIKQNTQKLITNWTDFSVEAGKTVTFVQPSQNAVALNRVTGKDVSTIAGTLASNGRVFLINPNGVLVTSGANVSLGSLVASTLDLNDDDFLSGAYRFTGKSTGSVINKGRIVTSTEAGDAYIALIANEVGNEGSLHAGPHGTAALAAGNDVTLQLGGPIQLRVQGDAAKAVINNSGSVIAPSGQVLLTASGDSSLKAVTINQSGILNASSVTQEPGGRVRLTAPQGDIAISGTVVSDGSLEGGELSIASGTVTLSGKLSAAASSSGEGRGGTVGVDAATTLNISKAASVLATGATGGRIALQAPDTVQVAGAVSAAGTAPGQGGEVTASAGKSLDVSAGNFVPASGQGGALVFTAPTITLDTVDGSNKIRAAQVSSWVDSGQDVVLRGTSDVEVNTALTASKGSRGLSLIAGRSVLINGAVDVGKASLTVVANAQDSDLKADRKQGSGALTMGTGSSLTSKAAVNLIVDGDTSATDAGGMTLTRVQAGALAVDSAAFSGTIKASNKVYDGTVAAVMTTPVVNGLTLSSSNLTLSSSGQFADKAAGTGKAVTGNLALAGFDTADAKRSSTLQKAGRALTVNAVADITRRTLQVSQLSASDKIYDGSTQATARIGADDRVAGDQLTLSWAAAFDNKNVGTGKRVTISNLAVGGADAGNYTVNASALTTQAAITRRELVLAGLTASDKTYDGTTAATVNFAQDNRIAGDTLTVAAQGQFTSKNVGSGKRVQVQPQSVSLGGADAGNYFVALAEDVTSASIAQRRLTLSGLAAANRVFDGTLRADVRFSGDDRVAGDQLDVVASGQFDNAHAGNGKRVTVTQLALAGADADNYRIDPAVRETVASITQRALTVSQVTGQTKVYDGTRTAQVLFGTDNRVAGDDLHLSATASFDNKQAGSGKRIDVQGIALSGANAGDYTVTATGLSTTGTIERRALSLSGLRAQDKTYDGQATANVSFSRDDRVAGDQLVVTATGAFDDKRAGSNKTVTARAALSGADAGNYVVSLAEDRTQASIFQRQLTLSGLIAADRVYDGTQRATVRFAGDDRVAGDQLTVLANGQFDNAHAGSNKRVTVTQLALGGVDADNYRIEPAVRETTASISRRALTVSQVVAQNKVYDGTRAAQVVIGADDRVAGDDLTLTATGSFDTKQAGTGKRVEVQGIALSGANAGDYIVRASGLSTTADIARRVLSLSDLQAQDKTYDGTRAAQIRYGRNDRVAGDDVQVSATGQFESKQAGSNKRVTVDGVTLSGADAGNYVADFEGHSTRATIDPRLLTLSQLSASDKVYDGTRDARAVFGSDDRVAGDAVTVATTASFDSRMAGSGKTVTVTDVALHGADAGNYRVDAVGATTQAAIQQRLLTLTQLAALDKVYDQTVQAQVSAGGDDRVRGDLLTVALTGEFNDRHVGQNKTVTVTGVRLSGDDAVNYRVTDQPLTTTASVTPRLLKVGLTASDKNYDGQRDASVTFKDDRLSGDDLQLVGGVSQFADANAGRDKTVTASYWQLSGADAGNYQLETPSWQTTASIQPRVLHVSAPASVEFSQSLRPQAIAISHDALAVDPLQVVAGSLTWGRTDELARAATLSSLTIQGPGAGNYVLSVPTLSLAAVVNTPLPLPGASGQWLCTGAAQPGCASQSLAQRSWATEPVMAQASVAPTRAALVVREGGIHVPAQRLGGAH